MKWVGVFYEKNLNLITNLIKNFGIECAKENYLDMSIFNLDKFAKKYNNDYIFHLTANEFNIHNNTIHFMNNHKENCSELTKEVVEYLLLNMKKEKFKCPYQLLGDFFDKNISKITSK